MLTYFKIFKEEPKESYECLEGKDILLQRSNKRLSVKSSCFRETNIGVFFQRTSQCLSTF